MTMRRIGTTSAVLVFIVAAFVGRAAGSASPASAPRVVGAAHLASPAAGTPPSLAEDVPQPWECQVDALNLLDLVGLAGDLSSESNRRPDLTRVSLDQLP